MKRIFSFLFIFFFLMTASACGSKKSSESNAPLLIDLEDGARITICGAHAELLKDSVTKWGAAIGRSYDIVLTCDVKDPTIRSYSSAEPASISLCDSMKATNRMFTEYSKSLTVYDCNKSPERVPASVLHETGHLFGLCDQYFQSSLPNCNEQAPMSSGSVMSAASSLKLTPDDIMGIRVLQALHPLKDAGSALALNSGYYVTKDASKKFLVKSDAMVSPMLNLSLYSDDAQSEFKCSKMNVCGSHSGGGMTINGDKSFSYMDRLGNSFDFEKNEESTKLLQNGYYATADESMIINVEADDVDGHKGSVTLAWPGGRESRFTCSIMKVCVSNAEDKLTITGETSFSYVDTAGQSFSLRKH